MEEVAVEIEDQEDEEDRVDEVREIRVEIRILERVCRKPSLQHVCHTSLMWSLMSEVIVVICMPEVVVVSGTSEAVGVICMSEVVAVIGTSEAVVVICSVVGNVVGIPTDIWKAMDSCLEGCVLKQKT